MYLNIFSIGACVCLLSIYICVYLASIYIYTYVADTLCILYIWISRYPNKEAHMYIFDVSYISVYLGIQKKQRHLRVLIILFFVYFSFYFLFIFHDAWTSWKKQRRIYIFVDRTCLYYISYHMQIYIVHVCIHLHIICKDIQICKTYKEIYTPLFFQLVHASFSDLKIRVNGLVYRRIQLAVPPQKKIKVDILGNNELDVFSFLLTNFFLDLF
jgi:hypothetical protein